MYFYEAIAPKLKQLESRDVKAKAVQSCTSKAKAAEALLAVLLMSWTVSSVFH
jgi:hypothetical protein